MENQNPSIHSFPKLRSPTSRTEREVLTRDGLIVGDTRVWGSTNGESVSSIWITCTLIINHITLHLWHNWFLTTLLCDNPCLKIPYKSLRRTLNWIIPVAKLAVTSLKTVFFSSVNSKTIVSWQTCWRLINFRWLSHKMITLLCFFWFPWRLASKWLCLWHQRATYCCLIW